MRWRYPLDPECPEVKEFQESLGNSPDIPSDVISDLVKDFEFTHRNKCKRCRSYGVANVYISDS